MLSVVAVSGCASNDDRPRIATPPDNDGGVLPNDAGNVDLGCDPVHAQPIPARLAVMSADAGVVTQTQIFVDDIFNRFNANCGSCHVSASQGGFQVSRSSFAALIDQKVIDRLSSNDATRHMPPPPIGKPASQRTAEDPVSQLKALIEAWMAAGKPTDTFYQETSSSDADHNSEDQYLLSPTTGDELSNIGSCLPHKGAVASMHDAMDELDVRFAQMQATSKGEGTLAERVGLPEHLSETDLFTLDTATLARHGVIAYAPTYPLWSDDAGKLRLVRVPRGQSISFDKTAQQFVIPPNTRFYKTFLKRIKDTDGSMRYRKIETRIIVSRPDQRDASGTLQPASLFGTYVWNETETDAVLLTDPLRNGEPFSDRLITYVADEPLATEVHASNPANVTYALQNAKAIRHYAIPGSVRCIDCHVGSPSQSFILGFTPLQVKRRPLDTGGVIDPATPDELGQLQRLIDYGIISGVESAGDILNLEDTQGSRKPRNEHELIAQGYMVGNCAHCHNPNGNASRDNPVLTDVLDFMPGPNTGIFQMPLEKVSPRITRGPASDVSIPYITPSLVDYPSEGQTSFAQKADADGSWPTHVNEIVAASTEAPGVPSAAAFAPWRSLIYRNVDTPFAYSDDLALFPHMPKDVPGFDCRLPQIMGDWMVSIPAKRKRTEIWEYYVPVSGTCRPQGSNFSACDTEPQPYAEVLPSDPDYAKALEDANARLQMYHEGTPAWVRPTYGPFINRYRFCPDTSDIVDIKLLYADPNTCSPQLVPGAGSVFDFSSGQLVMPSLAVPLRAHWVTTDLTEVPGNWEPRRPDWESILVQKDFPAIVGSQCGDNLSKQTTEKTVVNMLQSVTLNDAIRSYALREIPFGLWVDQPNCKLQAEPTVAKVVSEHKPKWLDRVAPAPDPNGHVYMQLPGAAVFNTICTNCHGQSADSRGRMADSLMTMTGGNVRVANLRDGLFGPVNGDGANRQRVFGAKAATLGISAEDLGSRYLAWMALGGTKATIPPSILNIVANTQILGQKRHSFQSVTAASANMLSAAVELCRNVVPWNLGYQTVDFDPRTATFNYDHSALISSNGDAELWETLCSIGNSPPIRAISADDWTKGGALHLRPLSNVYRREGYPSNTPIADQSGKVKSSLTDDNLMPWCIIRPTDAAQTAIADQYVTDHGVDGTPLPYCPESLLSGGHQMLQDLPGTGSRHEFDDWAVRGAINAALAVFLYLDQVVAHGYKPKPDYNRCDLINPQ
jgi:mono/diheme cytochrome c family protein